MIDILPTIHMRTRITNAANFSCPLPRRLLQTEQLIGWYVVYHVRSEWSLFGQTQTDHYQFTFNFNI